GTRLITAISNLADQDKPLPYFNHSQRQSYSECESSPSSTAAALAYGLERGWNKEENALISDLGGGAVNVSILRIKDGPSLKSNLLRRHSFGSVKISITDMVDLLCPRVQDESTRRHHTQQACQLPASEQREIYPAPPKLPLKLTHCFDGIDLHRSITRARFENCVRTCSVGTLEPVEKALRDAKMDKCQIHEVVLVGGSTRIPKVQKLLLQDLFNGKELNKSINQMRQSLMSSEIQRVWLIDVAPHFTRNRNHWRCHEQDHCEEFHHPTQESQPLHHRLYPGRGEDKPNVKVYEGERAMTKGQHLLGSFDLSGIRPATKRITFYIDTDGILNVSIADKSTGKSETITIKNDKGLEQGGDERMIADAEKKMKCSKRESRPRINWRPYLLGVKRAVQEVLKWLDNNPLAEKEEYEDRLKEMMLMKMHGAGSVQLEELDSGASWWCISTKRWTYSCGTNQLKNIFYVVGSMN
ncbi:Heat shock 70 kDa protein, partial [Orchesella cincta]